MHFNQLKTSVAEFNTTRRPFLKYHVKLPKYISGNSKKNLNISFFSRCLKIRYEYLFFLSYKYTDLGSPWPKISKLSKQLEEKKIQTLGRPASAILENCFLSAFSDLEYLVSMRVIAVMDCL